MRVDYSMLSKNVYQYNYIMKLLKEKNSENIKLLTKKLR